MDVVIAGAGLAGLAAARHLASAGADVTVYERNDAVGGRVRSVRENGYVFDRGFQVLFTGYPAVRRELDLDALDLRYFTKGVTIAKPNSRSVLAHPLDSPWELTNTLFSTAVTVRDKARLLAVRLALADLDATTLFEEDGRESIADWLAARGFSSRFVEHVARPFVGGVTLDRSLSSDADVLRSVVAALADGRIAVPATGMGAVSEQLAALAGDAGARIERETPVRRLSADGRDAVTIETPDETRTADAAVVATDPETAGELTAVADLPDEWRGCVTQYLSLPRHVTLDAGRKLLLNAGESGPDHVAPLSNVAPSYAPDDRRLLSATWIGLPDASPAELASEVRETLAAWYPSRQFEGLDRRRTDRIERAQIAQPPGFAGARPPPDAPDGPVVLAGDYTRWSSIQGALESGRIAADRLLDSE